LACLCSCTSKEGANAAPSAVDASPNVDLAAVDRAEDLRRAKDVSEGARISHDPAVRARAAEALARIADSDSIDGLFRAIEDEDPTTVAWGAFGLGAACKGREDAVVKALVARAASFEAFDVGPDGISGLLDGGRAPRDAVDPRAAIALSVGRCGGGTAEAALASWVRRRDALGAAAAYALGGLAGRRGSLADATMDALLTAAATPPPPPPGVTLKPALGPALYPFGRLEHVPPAFASRVAKAALAAIAAHADSVPFAVRALGRTGPDAAAALERVVVERSFGPAERADAARALRSLGDEGHAAAAEALAALAPSKDAFDLARLGSDDDAILVTLVGALGSEIAPDNQKALYALATLAPPGSPPAPLARRLAVLRCGAAAALAEGAYDSDVLAQCDDPASQTSEGARLTAVLRRPLVGARRAAWTALAKSVHPQVREAALQAIGDHPELDAAARAALAAALASQKAGLVATAAEILHAHPDRAFVLTDDAKRAALNPSSRPSAPAATSLRSLDPAVAPALVAALSRTWPEDDVETRTALVDAAVAVALPAARASALTACHDRNVTIRDRAMKALRELADPTPDRAQPAADIASCGPPADPGPAAPELGHPLAHDTLVAFSTDAGDLSIVFEPALAPIATARFVALAKSGFYDGVVVHRVVPGFVAQFGDPEGDGFGGAGKLLRCETSPVPFGPLDVGVALAGRDTGSSQLFVTLARVPHLDGEYARVGHAEGDWWSLAEGDVIHGVKVTE
jgi:cyclophilin family peptidyl-prolyl cis-trans isomerase/HEAT repeat protein